MRSHFGDLFLIPCVVACCCFDVYQRTSTNLWIVNEAQGRMPSNPSVLFSSLFQQWYIKLSTFKWRPLNISLCVHFASFSCINTSGPRDLKWCIGKGETNVRQVKDKTSLLLMRNSTKNERKAMTHTQFIYLPIYIPINLSFSVLLFTPICPLIYLSFTLPIHWYDSFHLPLSIDQSIHLLVYKLHATKYHYVSFHISLFHARGRERNE